MERKLLLILLTLATAVLFVCGCTDDAAPSRKNAVYAALNTGSVPKAQIKVALVFTSDGKGERTAGGLASSGLERAVKRFGEQIETCYVEFADPTLDASNTFRDLARDGWDLIFVLGFQFAESVSQVRSEFLDTKFVLVDGWIPGLDKDSNVMCVSYREHEGSFLIGAAAALRSKTGRIGFIGSIRGPWIERFEAGFVAGAKTVNPKIIYSVDYVGLTLESLANATKAKELALKQYNAGIDVIYHAAGGSYIGVVEAATARRKLVIGAGSDHALASSDAQRPYILTSMLKRVDLLVFETIDKFAAGKFEGGYALLGLAEGGVGYAVNQFNQEVMDELGPELEELKAKIISGEIAVPANNHEL